MNVIRKDNTAQAFQWNNQPQDELPGWLVPNIDRVSNFTGRLHLNDDMGFAEPGEYLVLEGTRIDIYEPDEFHKLFEAQPDGS